MTRNPARISIEKKLPPRLQRAEGGVSIEVVRKSGMTRLVALRQNSPCRAFFPRVLSDDPMDVILVNTGGGLVEGDHISTKLHVDARAKLHVTTQSAEKIYRSITETSVMAGCFTIADNGLLLWLPQETILFEGARLSRRQEVNVAPSARFLAAEVTILGRIARGERLTYGQLHDSWSIRCNGKLIWMDALRLDGDMAAHRARRFGLGDAVGYGTVIYYGNDAASFLPIARDIAAYGGGGASMVNGILLARFLSNDEAGLRSALSKLANELRPAVTRSISRGIV